MSAPVVFQYQQALDEFRREGREPPLLKRMSELISLLDLTITLGSSVGGAEPLDAALLVVMGELQVSRAALFVAEGEGRYRRRAAQGPSRRSTGGPRGGRSRGGAVRPGAGCPRRGGVRSRVPGAQGGPAARPPRSRAPGRGAAVRGRGAGLSREPRRLRRDPHRERARLRGAAAGQPLAVRQGVPAPQPLRRRPRAQREPRRGVDRAARDHDGHGPLPRHPLRALPARRGRAHPRPRAGREGGRGPALHPGRRGPPPARASRAARHRRPRAGGAAGGPREGAVRARGAARGGGAAERCRRGGGAAGRARVRRGGPRLRRRPRAAGPGRARGRAGAAPPRREGAPGPRAPDRARDPAEPLPADLAAGGGLRGRGPEPLVLRGRAATTTTSSPSTGGGWGS